MSSRSVYFRNQADKCLRHANEVTDAHTQAELRKLAAEYLERAANLKSERADV